MRKTDRILMKIEARKILKETRPGPRMVTLAFLLLTGGLTTGVGMFTTDPLTRYQEYLAGGISPDIALGYALSGNLGLSVFLSILVALFGMVVSFGYAAWALGRSRREEAGYGTLLSGFALAGRVIGLNLFIALFTFLWAMAVLIPAAILMAVVIAGFGGALLYGGGVAAISLLIVVIYAAAVVLLLMIVLRYAMATYALVDDPEAGIRAAVRRSKELMAGNKWSYVVLHLSFIGWYLLQFLLELVSLVIAGVVMGVSGAWDLSALPDMSMLTAAMNGTLGTVLMFLVPLALELWLVPYIQVTEATFYNALVSEQNARRAEAFPEL